MPGWVLEAVYSPRLLTQVYQGGGEALGRASDPTLCPPQGNALKSSRANGPLFCFSSLVKPTKGLNVWSGLLWS